MSQDFKNVEPEGTRSRIPLGRRATMRGLLAEVIFIVLPLGVVWFVSVFVQAKPLSTFLAAPEWAFAAVVLYGQGIVKFGASMAVKGGLEFDTVSLLFSVFIFLTIVSVLVLGFVLAAPQGGLFVAQVVLCVGGVFAFVGLGRLGLEARK